VYNATIQQLNLFIFTDNQRFTLIGLDGIYIDDPFNLGIIKLLCVYKIFKVRNI